MKKLAILCALFLVLWSCSLFRKKVPPYPSGLIFPVEEASQIEYQGEINNPMKKRGDHVYISTRAGILYCIEGSSQNILWQVRLAETLLSPPFLGEENIYVFDQNNTLFCLNKEGKALWERQVGDVITSHITEFGDKVCLGTDSGWFIAIDIIKADRSWAFKAQDAIRSNPVIADGKIVFGSDDQNLYILSLRGNLIQKFAIGGKIGETLAMDGEFVYLGSGNREILCINLKKQKRKWKIRTGGELLVPPVFADKRGFFACMDNVLYCLNKKGGEILWWSVIPSRAYYHLMIVGDKIVVTSLSSLLISFDLKTGEKVGEFQSARELRSNPMWCDPHMLVNHYDPETDKGTLISFQKKVAVDLLPSKSSPQKINAEIVVTAAPSGFYLPAYEFSLCPMVKLPLNPYFFVLLKKEEEKRVVQEQSEVNTWEWFPEKDGIYSIGVRVIDEREEAEAEIPFLIEKEDAVVILALSKDSPQPVGEEIVLTANARGMSAPKFEFSLSRVYKFAFYFQAEIFIPTGRRILQEYSEESSWTWIPEREGIYALSVTADDGAEKVQSSVVYTITKKKDTEVNKNFSRSVAYRSVSHSIAAAQIRELLFREGALTWIGLKH
jgi:outer membrane protein assembly factor BamB